MRITTVNSLGAAIYECCSPSDTGSASVPDIRLVLRAPTFRNLSAFHNPVNQTRDTLSFQRIPGSCYTMAAENPTIDPVLGFPYIPVKVNEQAAAEYDRWFKEYFLATKPDPTPHQSTVQGMSVEDVTNYLPWVSCRTYHLIMFGKRLTSSIRSDGFISTRPRRNKKPSRLWYAKPACSSNTSSAGSSTSRLIPLMQT